VDPSVSDDGLRSQEVQKRRSGGVLRWTIGRKDWIPPDEVREPPDALNGWPRHFTGSFFSR
jgi:hypothetical protein